MQGPLCRNEGRQGAEFFDAFFVAVWCGEDQK